MNGLGADRVREGIVALSDSDVWFLDLIKRVCGVGIRGAAWVDLYFSDTLTIKTSLLPNEATLTSMSCTTYVLGGRVCDKLRNRMAAVAIMPHKMRGFTMQIRPNKPIKMVFADGEGVLTKDLTNSFY